jgi:L-asparaginase II
VEHHLNHPILVELIRGAIVESVHRGSVAVVDADGHIMFSAGSVDRPVYPRSAMKMIQALPLVESGAADAYGFGNVELSLACASHSSEPEHARTAGKMLGAAGLAESDLECGAHWPLIGVAGEKAKIEMARAGEEPSQLHNNCSGKHAGFLCCAKHSGMKTDDYLNTGHELQRDIVATMEDVTGEAIPGDQCGVDGCSAPTLAASLKGLAQGFAKLGTGTGLEPVRAKSAKRLMQACMAEPWYMAGTNRFCTRVMEIGRGRVFAKMGAEGVYTGAIPELGLGIAIKADDGAERAAEMMLAGVLQKLLGNDTDLGEEISALTTRPINNWNGINTGEMRSVPL